MTGWGIGLTWFYQWATDDRRSMSRRMALGKSVRSVGASRDSGAVIGKSGSFGFTWFYPIGPLVDLQWFIKGSVRP